MQENPIFTHLQELEEKLLQQEVRNSPSLVGELLADDFIEHGSSGKVYTRAQVIKDLEHETRDISIKAQDFIFKELAPEAILLRYKTIKTNTETGAEEYAWRSSIWILKYGKWQMQFHQGTRTIPFTK
jgi:hypothetical protein